MTDDTRQPIVDGLAALEAARSKRRLMAQIIDGFDSDLADYDPSAEALSKADDILNIVEDALDAASPMTTPTPDQGALERAQNLARSWYYLQSSRKWELSGPVENTAVTARVMAAFFDDVANLIATAASEARAAAIAECAQVIDALRDETTDGIFRSRYRSIGNAIRALATPAQSEKRHLTRDE